MYLDFGLTIAQGRIEHWCHLANELHLTPGPGGSTFAPFAKAAEVFAPTFEEIHFLQPKQVTVVALWPSSQIVGHKDHPDNVHGRRLHIPLQVNPGCWVFHDGTWQQLELGKAYEMDPTLDHGAVNWGTEVRMHLVVDLT